MGELTKEDLQEVLREALNERNAIGGEQHHTEHAFIQMLMAREKKSIARWEKFKMSMIGGFAMACVGWLIWLGTLLWDAAHHVTPPPH